MKNTVRLFISIVLIFTMIFTSTACSLKPHQEIYYVAEEFASALIERDKKKLKHLSYKLPPDFLDLLDFYTSLQLQDDIYDSMYFEIDAGSIDNHPWENKGSIDIVLVMLDYRDIISDTETIIDSDLSSKAIAWADPIYININLKVKKIDGEWLITNSNQAIVMTYSWVEEIEDAWNEAFDITYNNY